MKKGDLLEVKGWGKLHLWHSHSNQYSPVEIDGLKDEIDEEQLFHGHFNDDTVVGALANFNL